MPDGTRVSTDEGTPQGGPLSPLLSNVVLDEFDKELARRGLRFVRYADDCNIFVWSERAGQRVMSSIRKFLQNRLRLLVNEEKSKSLDLTRSTSSASACGRPRIGRRWTCSSRHAPRSGWTPRSGSSRPRVWGQSPSRCIEQLNVYLRGWSSYFRIRTEENVYRLHVCDAHIRRRLRAILVRQKIRPRHLYRHLRQRGASVRAATHTAYSRRGVWYRSNT